MYPQIFGKYLLEREIAQGGMAVVHLATLRGAEGFEKRLVVKQIREDYAQDRDFIERFVREAKTNVSLNHPNIVTIYELGIERGTYFIAMEYIEGASISEILRSAPGGRLTAREGAFVGAELARALDYAHRKMQVIHRDVTPRNVVVDEEGQVKLIDFGIAARVKGTRRETFGSPGHMAPEQIEGGELGPATDLFALAALLLEIWGGAAPFRKATEEECREAVLHSVRPRPSELDSRLAELDALFERALDVRPSARPPFAEFEETLRAFVQKSEPGTTLRALGERARKAREEHALTPTPKKGLDLALPVHGESKTFATRASLRQKLDGEAHAADAEDARQASEGLSRTREVPEGIPSTRRLSEDASSTRDRAESPGTAAKEAAAPLDEKGGHLSTQGRWALAIALFALGLVGVRMLGSKASVGSHGGESPLLSASPSSHEVPGPTSLPSLAPRSAAAVESAIPSPTTAAAAERKLGSVRFVGDPGTLLFVDGKKQGAVPRSIDLAAGTHDVKLLFEPTGESHGEVVHVEKGDRLVLRSSFSGARPEIRVDREIPP